MAGLQKHISREDQIKLGVIDECGAVNPSFISTNAARRAA
jgi:hypothetical protein